MMMRLASAVLCFSILISCGGESTKQLPPVSAKPIGAPLTIPAPLGLPPVPIPADNPPTSDTVALGEKLFTSTLLSVDKTLACSHCHDPRRGFADQQPVSTGVGGKKGNRSAPTVWNSAYSTTQFWDGRAASLEEQASGPMMNPVEMAHSIKGAEQAIAANAELRAMFEKAFGPAPQGQSPVTMERITRAIASYERTVITGNSPFDKYQYGAEKNALNASAKRGLALFQDKAKGNCAVCHTIEEKYALFTDNKFHNLGTGMNAEGELTDLGRFDVTKADEDRGAFRTPTLRNIALTAPYMHDGSLKTLKEVIDFYVGGGNANPHRDKEIKELSHLTKQDRQDLVSFLESLTGQVAK